MFFSVSKHMTVEFFLHDYVVPYIAMLLFDLT